MAERIDRPQPENPLYDFWRGGYPTLPDAGSRGELEQGALAVLRPYLGTLMGKTVSRWDWTNVSVLRAQLEATYDESGLVGQAVGVNTVKERPLIGPERYFIDLRYVQDYTVRTGDIRNPYTGGADSRVFRFLLGEGLHHIVRVEEKTKWNRTGEHLHRLPPALELSGIFLLNDILKQPKPLWHPVRELKFAPLSKA